MRREIFNYFEIAGKTAQRNQDDRRAFLLGAIGIRTDGAMVKSFNAAVKIPTPEGHAEYRASKKLDVGSVVYVARIRRKDGKFGMARPCVSCVNAMKARGVIRCYFTTDNPGEYGILDLSN